MSRPAKWPHFLHINVPKAPKAKPKRSQPHSINNPTWPCDGPHVPTTHAPWHWHVPTKGSPWALHACHDTCPWHSHVLVQKHTPWARPSDRRQAPTPSRQPMCMDSCTWHGDQPHKRTHKCPHPQDGRPRTPKHGMTSHAGTRCARHLACVPACVWPCARTPSCVWQCAPLRPHTSMAPTCVPNVQMPRKPWSF